MSERIRVLLLLPSLHGGGAERMAVHLMRRFDRDAFDMRMALLRRSGPYLDEVDPSLIDVSPYGQRFLDYERGNDVAYRPSSLLPGVVLAPLNVVTMMRRFRPHAVLSFRKGMSVCAMAAVRIYGASRVAFVAREGNNTTAVIGDELKSPALRRSVERLTALCYGSADRLLTISHEMADGLASELHIPRDRMRTVHNGVDLDVLREKARGETPLAPKGPYLLAVGRLERQKGYDTLLDAYAKSEAKQTLSLLILGEGHGRPALESKVRELGLEDRVSMPGFTDNPWAYMAQARAFLLPSRWEGFGLVVAEAMACGAPVIVSDCDFGPKEIVRPEESGIIVPVDDANALQQAMDRVAGDDALRERLAKAGRARAEDFDLTKIVRGYENVLREVVMEKGLLH